MRIRDYFAGIPVRLISPGPPQEVAERINDAAGSSWWPFNTGVVGRVWLKQVKLRYASSFAEYNAKPILVGGIAEAPSGSTLTLRYRAPAWAYIFDIIWYSILVLLVLLLLFGQSDPDLSWHDVPFIAAVLGAMFIWPPILHYFGTRNSDAELQYLLDFLAEQADARPAQPRPL